MVAWIPFLKASIPYITQIVGLALPTFTARTGAEKQDEITAKQIAELQAAATHNTEYVKTLAKQLQETIEGIEIAAIKAQTEIIFYRRLAIASIAIASAAFAVAVVALLK